MVDGDGRDGALALDGGNPLVQLMHMEMVAVMLYDGDDGFGAISFMMT